ncbi:hypothetical protein M8J75_002435 [Diaphorina citri]|nr:hypothetical protein M8J75_002435 [Diaphorina citri]
MLIASLTLWFSFFHFGRGVIHYDIQIYATPTKPLFNSIPSHLKICQMNSLLSLRNHTQTSTQSIFCNVFNAATKFLTEVSSLGIVLSFIATAITPPRITGPCLKNTMQTTERKRRRRQRKKIEKKEKEEED